MKKSTLITTIAMVVVVVVALSTATYAWFTSSSQATAGGNIQVTAESNWSIMGADVSESSALVDTVAYNTNSSLDLVLMDGLFSPTAPIAGTITGYSYSSSFGNLATWFEATQKGTGYQGTATIDAAASIKPKTFDTTQRSPVSYIRVENGKTEPADLQLTITVYLATSTPLQKQAAQQLCVYLAANVQSGELAGTSYVANTAYEYGTITESTASKAGAIGTYSVPASEDGSGTLAITGNRTWISAATQALDAKYTTGSENIATGEYYQLTVVFEEVPVGYGVNIAMYTWFNGWRIDSTANGTNADVYLAFGDAA